MTTVRKDAPWCPSNLEFIRRINDLANLDLCYAPPYAPAMDNIITAANILRNKIDGLMEGITAADLKAKMDAGKDFLLLDLRSPAELEQQGRLEGAVNIPLGKLRSGLDGIAEYKNKEVVAFCKISLRGYEAARILKSAGFADVKVLDGGILMWPYKKITG